MSVRPAHRRSRARSWALQFLYGWEAASGGAAGTGATAAEDLGEYARQQMRRRRIADRYRDYALQLVDLVGRHLAELDRLLAGTIPNWRLERLSVVDRNILRIGAAELLYVRDVPRTVAIHEAIKLAEKYGSLESPRFVNGVLDAIGKHPAPSGPTGTVDAAD